MRVGSLSIRGIRGIGGEENMKITFYQHLNLGRSLNSGKWFNPLEATKEQTDDEKANMRARKVLLDIYKNAEIVEDVE